MMVSVFVKLFSLCSLVEQNVLLFHLSCSFFSYVSLLPNKNTQNYILKMRQSRFAKLKTKICSFPIRLLAVIQLYETDVAKEYVILGNDALIKCSIPSFVADFVSVISWTTSEDELKSYTQENSRGKLKLEENIGTGDRLKMLGVPS